MLRVVDEAELLLGKANVGLLSACGQPWLLARSLGAYDVDSDLSFKAFFLVTAPQKTAFYYIVTFDDNESSPSISMSGVGNLRRQLLFASNRQDCWSSRARVSPKMQDI